MFIKGITDAKVKISKIPEILIKKNNPNNCFFLLDLINFQKIKILCTKLSFA